LGVFSVHFFAECPEAIGRTRCFAPDSALKLELCLLTLNLHLKALHETLTVQNALVAGRVLLNDALRHVALDSIRSSHVLSISEHEIQLTSLQLVALGFFSPCCLDVL
jgi:hypothetical protein